MKQVLIYSNIAKNSKVIYNPLSGRVEMFKAKETKDNEDIVVMNTIKTHLENNPGENFTFIINSNLAIPAFQAMKVVNLLILKKYTEDDEETIDTYMANLDKAGIDITTLNLSSKEDVIKLVKGAMGNTWLNETVLDYVIRLALTSEHKFINIDKMIDEPKDGVVLSAVSKYVRELALELVNETCAIPVLQKIMVDEDDEEIAQ